MKQEWVTHETARCRHMGFERIIILCQSRTGFETRTSHYLKWDTIRTLWLRVQIGIKEDSVNYRLLDTLFFTYKLSICVLVGKVLT
jgi:hypothetical protein